MTLPPLPEGHVSFKSTVENYWNEANGDKCNTVRRVPKSYIDKRFQMLESGQAEFIRITDVDENIFFVRRITNVTWWEDLCIISWSSERIQ